ncbi:MAG: ABC transporter ATP-binding protein [Betaproteobacteria bacterium]|nr:ABC transporter ATP-binding protein [Betaproteobacteria bacterium]
MLEITGLQAWYGKSQVLHGVDCRVGAGEIVAVLGRNGAGRSTLARAIMGWVQSTGSVRVHGQEMLGQPVHARARAGLGYVPESRDVFPGLSVQHNLALGEKPGQRHGRWTFADMYRLFPQLAVRRDARAGVLSGGEQQMLALARALMGDPHLLIVDEPTEGLAPQLVAQVADFLVALRGRGVSVLLIEQKLPVALRIADRCLVMGHGRVVFGGVPADLPAATMAGFLTP